MSFLYSSAERDRRKSDPPVHLEAKYSGLKLFISAPEEPNAMQLGRGALFFACFFNKLFCNIALWTKLLYDTCALTLMFFMYWDEEQKRGKEKNGRF